MLNLRSSDGNQQYLSLPIHTMTSAASWQISLLMVKHHQVLWYLNPFSVMAYSGLMLMMTSGRMWVWMMSMMVGYHCGLVMKGYAWGFKPYSSMIDAVRRRFGLGRSAVTYSSGLWRNGTASRQLGWHMVRI